MKRKIGLFFGSFNPVHVGHLIIANYMVEHTSLEEVWMVVSPHNPFKEKKDLAPEKDRINMMKLALKGKSKIKASNVEFKLPKPSYTINTLKYLKKVYPKNTFSIIIGSDNLKGLPNWKSASTLLANYTFHVYLRSGYNLGSLKKHKNITLHSAPLLNISGTYIRNQVKEKKSISYLVMDQVNDYIAKNSLYK